MRCEDFRLQRKKTWRQADQDRTKTAKCGDTITYTFTVENTGNTCLYGGIQVFDALRGNDPIWHKSPFAPGETFTFEKKYVVKESDKDPLVNKAVAFGHPPG